MFGFFRKKKNKSLTTTPSENTTHTVGVYTSLSTPDTENDTGGTTEESFVDEAKNTLESASDTMSDVVDTVTDTVSDAYETVHDKVTDVVDDIRDTEGAPWSSDSDDEDIHDTDGDDGGEPVNMVGTGDENTSGDIVYEDESEDEPEEEPGENDDEVVDTSGDGDEPAGEDEDTAAEDDEEDPEEELVSEDDAPVENDEEGVDENLARNDKDSSENDTHETVDVVEDDTVYDIDDLPENQRINNLILVHLPEDTSNTTDTIDNDDDKNGEDTAPQNTDGEDGNNTNTHTTVGSQLYAPYTPRTDVYDSPNTEQYEEENAGENDTELAELLADDDFHNDDTPEDTTNSDDPAPAADTNTGEKNAPSATIITPETVGDVTVETVLDGTPYNIVLIRGEVQDLKKTITETVGDTPVFVYDMSQEKNGYSYIDVNVNQQFGSVSPLSENYSGDPAYIVYIGLDNASDRVVDMFNGRPAAVEQMSDMVVRHIHSAVNNVTIIIAGETHPSAGFTRIRKAIEKKIA